MKKTGVFSSVIHIDEGMINAFASLTGDFNSLHMNEEVARKSRFRTRIVHGMLPFSMLSLLNFEFPDHSINFKSFRVRFLRPVFYDQDIKLEIEYGQVSDELGSGYSFTGSISTMPHGEKLTDLKGTFDLSGDLLSEECMSDDVGDMCLLYDELREEQNSIDMLEVGKEVSLPFSVDNKKLDFFLKNIVGLHNGQGTRCSNLTSSLLLSTLVGMKIPGRYATFSSFSIEFNENVPSGSRCNLLACIVKASRATEVVKTDVTIDCDGAVLARGKVESLVNPPPVKMLTCKEICDSGLNSLGLKDKVVLVTGSSRGVGETAVKLLAMLGCKVVITYYKGKVDAISIADDIAASGGDALVIQCDVTDEASVEGLFDEIENHYGTVDVLVNNAVKEFSSNELETLNWEDFERELDVTLKGAHLCCKRAIPAFKSRKSGKIINISTIAVANPPAGQAKYIAAKSALEGYTKSLAKDLVKYNVQANLIVPNMAETDLVASIPTAYRHKIANSRPYGRHIKPIEIAQSIAFLGSHWSDAITGQKIVLNLGEPPFA